MLVILLLSLQFVVAVGFLLVVVLAFTYPQSGPQLGLVNLGCYNWSSPLSHVRLLSLPIAKKYNLQGLSMVTVFLNDPLTHIEAAALFMNDGVMLF